MNFLVRHGQSEGNADPKNYFLKPDEKIALTEKGKIQAADAGRLLSNYIEGPKVLFLVSPFLRTMQTMHHILTQIEKVHKIEKTIETDELMVERMWTAEFRKHINNKTVPNRSFDFLAKPFGTESYSECLNRAKTVFLKWSSIKHEYDHSIFVGHGEWIAVFHHFVIDNNLPETFNKTKVPANGQVLVFDVELDVD